MAALVEKVTGIYEKMLEKGDPRVDDWLLMPTPFPSFFICVAYVSIVIYLGPRFMKNREPYNIKTIMVLYNFIMVLVSAYIFIEFGLAGWFTNYSFGCQPVDYSPQGLRMARVAWLFSLTKYLEMLDTIFFVLRKKYSHISFLHVFHHSALPFSWWFGIKYVAGGHFTFHATINTFIHLVMYTYYGIAALGPKYQKYLWWKKQMTILQLIQFVMMFVHSTSIAFNKDCNTPAFFFGLIAVYAGLFFVLFGNFYIKAYHSKQKPDRHHKNGEINHNGLKNGHYQNGQYQNGHCQNGYYQNGSVLKKNL